MSKQEKYWAGYILRKAQDRGWVSRSNELTGKLKLTYFGWIVQSDPSSDSYFEEWLHEQVYTALTNEDPKIAFRALLQSERCMLQCENRKIGHGLGDAQRCAKQRIEDMLQCD